MDNKEELKQEREVLVKEMQVQQQIIGDLYRKLEAVDWKLHCIYLEGKKNG